MAQVQKHLSNGEWLNCGAQPGNCPIQGEDGKTVEHMVADSPQEMQQKIEADLEQRHGTTASLGKKSDTNTPEDAAPVAPLSDIPEYNPGKDGRISPQEFTGFYLTHAGEIYREGALSQNDKYREKALAESQKIDADLQYHLEAIQDLEDSDRPFERLSDNRSEATKDSLPVLSNWNPSSLIALRNNESVKYEKAKTEEKRAEHRNTVNHINEEFKYRLDREYRHMVDNYGYHRDEGNVHDRNGKSKYPSIPDKPQRPAARSTTPRTAPDKTTAAQTSKQTPQAPAKPATEEDDSNRISPQEFTGFYITHGSEIQQNVGVVKNADHRKKLLAEGKRIDDDLRYQLQKAKTQENMNTPFARQQDNRTNATKNFPVLSDWDGDEIVKQRNTASYHMERTGDERERQQFSHQVNHFNEELHYRLDPEYRKQADAGYNKFAKYE